MNADLDKRRNVLLAAGLAKSSEKLNAVEITKRFQRIKTTVIDITSGQPAQGIDFKNYDSKINYRFNNQHCGYLLGI